MNMRVHWIKSTVIGLVLIAVLFGASGFLTNRASSGTFSGPQGDELWSDIDGSSLAGERLIVPDAYRTLRLDKTAMQVLLMQAPLESQVRTADSFLIVSLPLPNGRFSRFRFVESPIMEDPLQAQYPEIRTYLGQGIDEPGAVTRFDLTPQGFHGMILMQDGSVFIDPYAKGDTDNYISYYKRDFQKDAAFACHFSNKVPSVFGKLRTETDVFDLVNNGGTLHTYRLAMAATGEYTQFYGGTVAAAMAGITTTMNRVNGVYQRDLSVRMVLVANNNLIVFTNPGGDPYANTSGDLGANQTTIDTIIGSANYDVGHLVGTGGGGVAALGVPCTAGAKAQGLTGSPAPVGDPFDIDYVAHEIGHQFGGNHTFNSTQSNCGGGNRAASAAYEPGSASTIQGYAGICGTSDLQRNSDDYFHIRSLEEMTAEVNSNACDIETADGNIVPVVTAAPACSIPINTPFELIGSATDANGDSLTYTWEEYDLGASTNAIPNSDAAGARPIFRSYRPTSGGATRTFPSLPFILNNANVPPSTFAGTNPLGTVCSFGSCLTGELLPQITRTMNFQLTARDNRAGSGAVRSAQTAVSVSAAAGPFAVTSPNTAVSLPGNSSQTITWNVANTTAAPVSCANVDILFSSNGGSSFPITLLSATPNDGSQTLTIPNTTTSNARIKIKCSTSCFFDISNTNFSILVATAAPAALGGRVVSALGFGLPGVIVQLADSSGGIRIARTNPFGYYSFDDVSTGQTYLVTVSHKRYSFAEPTQTVVLNDNVTSVDFVAE